MIAVNWHNTEHRTRSTGGKLRKDTFIEVVCDCGYRWHVRRDRVKHVRRCYHCSQQLKGKLGYSAVVQKYGENIAVSHAREYRLNNPTDLERAVMLILERRGVEYEREYLFYSLNGSAMFIDFLLYMPGKLAAVECGASYWHSLPGAVERDSVKRETLAYAHVPLLELLETDIYGGYADEMISAFYSAVRRGIPVS